MLFSSRRQGGKNRAPPNCARARQGHPFLSPTPSQSLKETRGGPNALARLAEGNVGGGRKPVHCEREPPPRPRARPRHSHSLTGARHGPCPTPGACAGRGVGRRGKGGEGGGACDFWPSYPEKFLERNKGNLGRRKRAFSERKTAKSPKYSA